MLDYPFDPNLILKKKRSIKRELLGRKSLVDVRIAILGGSTTAEIKDVLELFLLKEGIRPSFYESEYNKYYEDVMFNNPALVKFAPQIIYIHVTNINILEYPHLSENAETIEKKAESEFRRFKDVWEKIKETFNCAIIQNNFDLPDLRPLGNIDFSDFHGKTRFISRINSKIAGYAASNKDLLINDINYLSAWYGLSKWHDRTYWYSYKYAMNFEAIPFICHNLSRIISSIMGKSKKCLVLDLDNTLWGGVAGDDGTDNLKIGKETAVAEAYTVFQMYLKELKERGVMLAICSKSDINTAMAGLSHPDNILKFEDFLVFKANWEPKNLNIEKIAKELNISLDSIVFVDDNPAERDIVRSQLPEVSVPEIGDDIAKFTQIIDKAAYFEPLALSAEDLGRSSFYVENSKRDQMRSKFENYEEFLRSLEMKARISDFLPIYLDRITQLANKTNQFNLTTKRYTLPEIESISKSGEYIRLFGKLKDKYGDIGLISVIIGKINSLELHIELWIMSCRVVKRNMELAMFDELVSACRSRGIKRITGYYYPTSKNSIVSDHFKSLGFKKVSMDGGGACIWQFDIPKKYEKMNRYIGVDNGQ